MTHRVWMLVTAMLAVLAMSASRADDVVVDEGGGDEAGAGQGMVFVGGGGVDLVQMFDSQAFAGGQGFGMAVMMDDQGQMAGQLPADNHAQVTQRLEPVRHRLEARIKTVDRIVGLEEKQRKKLEIAAQSDLRRLTDTVAEARAKYAGRTLKMDPRKGGFDEKAQQEMQEVQQEAARCRELIGQAAGAGSLLAKVVTGTLDEAQATKYQAVMNGRRDCRWQAAVAGVLSQLDETLGFTQKQHEALTAALLAAPPSADELTGGGPMQPEPAVVLVATRLAAAVGGDTKLAAVLDPRQRAAMAEGLQQAGLWQAFPGWGNAPLAVPGIQMIVD
jgi:hypothetical protein